ncbi:MAG: decarboxylase [Nanoarchaeota archaeon]|nr:decarboxylase [Nanoarchaeota archaeon]
MAQPKFILSKKKILEQYNILKNQGLIISYSYKTNGEVGKVLQEVASDSWFSIHNLSEVKDIKNKSRILFFSQAWNEKQIRELLEAGIRNFVVDNEEDLRALLRVFDNIKEKKKINLSLRMKFQENRIGSGKYFFYGFSSRRVNELIQEIGGNEFIDRIGVHIHRKSQNTSEWNILQELKDSLTKASIERIDMINLGGGLPIEYKTYTYNALPYIFSRIKEVKDFFEKVNKQVEIFIEPGRFIAGPSVKLETEIIQVYDNTIVVNTTIYNCALDSVITGIKMIVENELEDDSAEGRFYLIKGNSPTRDDIFRYKVRLKNPKVGDKIVFLNAGAYNYTTDFFGYKKLKTDIEG